VGQLSLQAGGPLVEEPVVLGSQPELGSQVVVLGEDPLDTVWGQVVLEITDAPEQLAVPVQHPGVVPVNFWLRSLHESPGPAVDLHAAVLRLPLPARITTATAPRPLTRPQPSPQEQAAELARTAAHHPAYEITTELTAGRLRYVARARSLTTHPYLVIASTLTELTTELSSAQA
jgi:hypothetical protein